jgi:hypothetical protein
MPTLTLSTLLAGRTGRRLAAAIAVAGALGTFGFASAQVRQTQSFTEADVKAILEELRGVDPRTYFIRLPTYRYGRLYGSATYGSLPITEVRRVASLLDVKLDESANVITAFESGCDSSMQPAAATGQDLGDRIGTILSAIDSSQYQFLR